MIIKNETGCEEPEAGMEFCSMIIACIREHDKMRKSSMAKAHKANQRNNVRVSEVAPLDEKN